MFEYDVIIDVWHPQKTITITIVTENYLCFSNFRAKNNCRLGIFIYGVIKQLFDVKRWSSSQGSELIRSTCVLMNCDSVVI